MTSSSSSAVVLELGLRPALRLGAYLLAVHLAVALSVAATPIPGALRGLLLCGVLASLARDGWRHGGRSAPRQLECLAGGVCRIRDGRGRVFAGPPSRSTVAFAGLVILALEPQPGQAPRWVVLAEDAAGRNGLRRLRAWLRPRLGA